MLGGLGFRVQGFRGLGFRSDCLPSRKTKKNFWPVSIFMVLSVGDWGLLLHLGSDLICMFLLCKGLNNNPYQFEVRLYLNPGR